MGFGLPRTRTQCLFRTVLDPRQGRADHGQVLNQASKITRDQTHVPSSQSYLRPPSLRCPINPACHIDAGQQQEAVCRPPLARHEPLTAEDVEEPHGQQGVPHPEGQLVHMGRAAGQVFHEGRRP